MSTYSQQGSASTYLASRAILFAHFSNAAYCSASSIADWSCGPCKLADPDFQAKVFTSDKTGMQAFVGKAPHNDIVVSFRGSSNFENWVANLDFPKTKAYPKCDGCRVHEGFYNAWLSVMDGVVAEVTRLHTSNPSSRIFVTGHSLGGAVAAHCAAELGASRHSLGYPIDGVYTYGQPRVGNSHFASFYEEGTRVSWRVTHWKDVVPHLPPSALYFQHTSTEVHYVEDGSSYVVCDGSGEDPKCANQHLLYSVDDHHHYMIPPLANQIDTCPTG